MSNTNHDEQQLNERLDSNQGHQDQGRYQGSSEDTPSKNTPTNDPDQTTAAEDADNAKKVENAENQDNAETVPVRPPELNNRQKPRPGEILVDQVQEQTRTRNLGDTDFEDGDPRWGTARFNRRMLLEIKLRDSGATDQRFTFDYEGVEEIVIGRRDPKTDTKPDVDLEPFGALNKGVSRHHASIVRRDGALNLVDNGSPNGTFLNGQKLVAQQPRILRDGDDIRLGHLVVRVSFRRGNPF
jgi:hypothetical protein